MDGMCLKCDPSCQTCDGLANNCTSCDSNSMRIFNSAKCNINCQSKIHVIVNRATSQKLTYLIVQVNIFLT